MPFKKELEELKRRKEKALQMGGPEKVKRQHDQGRLTARERISVKNQFSPGDVFQIFIGIHKISPPSLPF